MARKTTLTEEMFNLVKEERFTKVLCGINPRTATTIEQCKSKYSSYLADQWIDTSKTLTPMGDIKGNSVYDIFGRMYKMPGSDVKWDVVDWMCDNRRELAANFSIPFRQQDLNITTWMQRVEKDLSPVDEFVLYCIGRMYNKHIIVLTSQEQWSTMSRQFQMSTQDVYAKSDIRLIYLGPGKYAEIRPNSESLTPLTSPSESVKTKEKPKRAATSKHSTKGKSHKKKTPCRTTGVKPSREKKSSSKIIHLDSSLQSARDRKYGLHTSQPVRDTRRTIDYAKLNDGLHAEDDSPTPKRRKQPVLPRRDGPSAERIAAAGKPTSTPESNLHSPPPVSRITDKPLTATPVTVGFRLTGGTDVLSVTPISAHNETKQTGVTVTPKSSSLDKSDTLGSGKLPDLIVNTVTNTPDAISSLPPPVYPTNIPVQDYTVDPPTTEDEGDAVDALLSLGSDLSNTASMEDILNENAALMPVGVTTVEDVNPVAIKLDQVSVDKTIANIIDQEQAEEALRTNTIDQNTEQEKLSEPVDGDSDDTIPYPALDAAVHTSSPKATANTKTEELTPHRGKVKITEYSVKRKVTDGKLKFPCPKCEMRFRSRREQNTHYRETHDPIMCDKCDKVFNNPASLSVHAYDHMEHRFKCDVCDRGFHFQGQLTQHKVLHRKEGKGTFQCMSARCGKWFIRKGDLVVHLECHKKKDWKCPHCEHVTTCEKYLKTHIKSRHETDEADYPYKCAVCDRRFLYRTQLSRHKDIHLKSPKA